MTEICLKDLVSDKLQENYLECKWDKTNLNNCLSLCLFQTSDNSKRIHHHCSNLIKSAIADISSINNFLQHFKQSQKDIVVEKLKSYIKYNLTLNDYINNLQVSEQYFKVKYLYNKMHLNLVSIIYRVKIEIFTIRDDELNIMVINNGFKNSIQLLTLNQNDYFSLTDKGQNFEDDSISMVSVEAIEKLIDSLYQDKKEQQRGKRIHKKSLSLDTYGEFPIIRKNNKIKDDNKYDLFDYENNDTNLLSNDAQQIQSNLDQQIQSTQEFQGQSHKPQKHKDSGDQLLNDIYKYNQQSQFDTQAKKTHKDSTNEFIDIFKFQNQTNEVIQEDPTEQNNQNGQFNYTSNSQDKLNDQNRHIYLNHYSTINNYNTINNISTQPAMNRTQSQNLPQKTLEFAKNNNSTVNKQCQESQEKREPSNQQHNLSNSNASNANQPQTPIDANFYTGTLKFFDEQKNYGFIIMDVSQQDIFVHYDDLNRAGISKTHLRTCKQGNMIRFQFQCMQYVGKYNKSKKAINLELQSEQYYNNQYMRNVYPHQ